MNFSSEKKSASSEVETTAKPQVASSAKNGKYVTIIFVVIVILIILQNFIRRPEKLHSAETGHIQAADTSVMKVDLGGEVPQYPVLPEPNAAPKPAPLPDLITHEEDAQARMASLKSPSLVFSATKTVSDQTGQRGQTGNNPNQAFGEQAANAVVPTIRARQITNTNYKILQGKFISATLETAIHSDLPGMVRAVTSKDIYGETGNVVLLPKGTRLVGQYNSSVAQGQTRVYIMWTRAITPEDIDISLGSPSADPLGQAGITGEVNTHFWKIFGMSMLISVLGAGASNYSANSSNTAVGAYGNPYQMAAIQGMLSNSNSVLQNNINIQPTISVPQGSAIQVFVARDLDFSGVMGGQ